MLQVLQQARIGGRLANDALHGRTRHPYRSIQRRQLGNGPAADGHLKALAGLDTAQDSSRVIAQVTR